MSVLDKPNIWCGKRECTNTVYIYSVGFGLMLKAEGSLNYES